MVAHELGGRASATWKARRWSRAQTAEYSSGGHRLILATTKTYMNVSGVPVRNLIGEFKVKPDHLIVIHDELDIDLGQIRVKFGGGDNGHNGLKSIRAHVGSGEFFRVRVGISRPNSHLDVHDWVLTNFASAEKTVLAEMITRAADAVESLVRSGLAQTQSQFNS
jgi:PTH1 family peptidyl-tRNA hydrolase